MSAAFVGRCAAARAGAAPTTTYGAYVRQARLEVGLTQRRLAALMGCSHVYVSEVELGTRGPFPQAKEELLASALGLDAMDRARLRELRAAHRQAVDVAGLSPKEVARVVRLVEKMRLLNTSQSVQKRQP